MSDKIDVRLALRQAVQFSKFNFEKMRLGFSGQDFREVSLLFSQTRNSR